MLYSNITGKAVHIAANKELTDNMKRMLREKLEPLPHKGHAFFRLEERAHGLTR